MSALPLVAASEASTFSFVVAITLSFFVYRLLRMKLENDRRAKAAQIEAELRLELAEKLGDAAQVQRVLDAPLRACGPAEPGAHGVSGAAGSRDPDPPPRDSEGHRRFLTRFVVLVGLTLFLVGIAFVIGASVTGPEELMLPGLICGAVGLAFLTYATSQKEILRAVGQDPGAQRS